MSLSLGTVHMRPARENNRSTSHEDALVGKTLLATPASSGSLEALSFQNPSVFQNSIDTALAAVM